MDEHMRKTLEDARKETREEIQKAMGETTQRTFDKMKVIQENFLAQQSRMQNHFRELMDQMSEFTRHRGIRGTPEEERRDPVKGKGAAAGEGPNVKVPASTPTQQFPTPQDCPYQTSKPSLYHQQPHRSTPRSLSFFFPKTTGHT